MPVTRAFAIVAAMSVLACTASTSADSTGDSTNGLAEADSHTGGVGATVGISDSSTATDSVVAIHSTLQELTTSATVDTKTDTVNLIIACDSGTARSTLTITSSGPGNTESTHRFQFNACMSGDTRISGNLDWTVSTTQSRTGGRSWVRFDGALAYEGPTFAGSYAFNALKIEYTSTSGGATYSVTGGFSVGGQMYSINKEYAVRFFQ